MSDSANNQSPQATSASVIPTIPPQDHHTHLSDLELSDAGVTASPILVERTVTTGRYVLTAFHARGGMGEVWRCQDSSIGREVAVKRLMGTSTAARERFLCEAQITGQLEHPSIVPVHDLGVDDNGQPFYVMKLVHGRTLSAAIDDFHTPVDGTVQDRDPRDLQRIRLLQIFLDLCHAVGYAHSRGVIHRDLKPENIMLGTFGETVVLDWGLAKISGQTEISAQGSQSGPSPGQSTLSSGNSAQTQDGSILGSPLYMPPEMAEGRHSEIDQRTDVYLLGATLYEILTGKPPRQGQSRQEILELARTAPPVHPRKLVSDTPAALAAICLKAMSRSRGHRYESAMSLATDIQRFLAGEPVSAYPQPRMIRAWRWAKRHRRVIFRCVVAVVFVVLATSALLLYHQSVIVRARELARAQVEQVRRLADQARFYSASVDSPNELMPYYQPTHGEELARQAMAIAGIWGSHLDQLPIVELREPLRQDLGDLCLLMARVNHKQQQLAYWQDRAHGLGADLGSGAAANAQSLFLDAEQARLMSDVYALPVLDDVNTKQRRTQSLLRAVEGFQATIALDPSHYWSHLQLGRCYLALGRGPQAVEVLGACIAMRPDAPWGYAVRGLAFSLMSRFDEAKRDLDRALVLDPECLAAHLNLGVMYRLQGMTEKAGAEFDALLAQPRPSAEAALYRSRIYMDEAKYDQALACLERESVDAALLPIVAYMKAEICLLRGDNNECLRQLDSIVQTPEQRGHLLRIIASELPRKEQKPALELAIADIGRASDAPLVNAATLADLGALLQQLDRQDQAIAAYSRSIAASPEVFQTIINRGWCYELLNQLDDARNDFSQALQIAPDQAEAMTGLGYIEARLGHSSEAQRQASLAILQAGNDYLILHNVACIYAQLSVSDPAQSKAHRDMAMELLRSAVREWRQGWRGRSEIDLIRQEPAFPLSMRQRSDFKEITSQAEHSLEG